MIPVVFAHKGRQEYVHIAIEQAKRHNKRVVLLGDESNLDLAPEYESWDALWNQHFADAYQHMTYNHREYTLRGMERWHALWNWMERNGEKAAWHFDTDVMLYCDVEEIDYGDAIAAIQIPRKPWPAGISASGHASYWTLEALRDFCWFMHRMYTSERGLAVLQFKWAFHMLWKLPGGVCDMTLLYIWSLGKNIINNARVIDGATFEHNINIAGNLIEDEYRMKDGIKEITMKSGMPRGWHGHRQEHITFNAIHFQGRSKRLMGEYET